VHDLGVYILVREDPPYLLVLVLKLIAELDESSSIHEDLEKDLLAQSALTTLVTLQVIILTFANNVQELLVPNVGEVASSTATDNVVVGRLVVGKLNIELVREVVLERHVLVPEKLLSKKKRRYSCKGEIFRKRARMNWSSWRTADNAAS